jgi:phosphoglycolate phosphatase
LHESNQAEELTHSTEETTQIREEKKQYQKMPWIFFDYSGTLIDTIAALTQTWRKFLGRNFSSEEVKELYKEYHEKNKLAMMIKHKINPIKYLFAGGRKKIEAIRKEEFWNNARAFPGIAEALIRLQKMAKINLGIFTHETEIENEERRKEVFDKFRLPMVFNAVLTDKKNKKETFSAFVEEHNIQDAIIIGDTQYDLNIANEHGFYAIGVTWGFSTREELEAHFIVDDPREILQIVMRLIHEIGQKKV